MKYKLNKKQELIKTLLHALYIAYLYINKTKKTTKTKIQCVQYISFIIMYTD